MIVRLDAEALEANLPRLGAIMAACVNDGASIGYLAPFSDAEGEAFWRQKILPGVREGLAHVFVANVDGRIAGTVVLAHDMPPNQPHRGDVKKLMVDPAARRKGLARQLMVAAEAHAVHLGLGTLVLDTRGDGADALYRSMGWQVAGIIPDYCVDTLDPTRRDPTIVMYKLI